MQESHGPLVGKVALVTGGSGGVGSASCAALARLGADVVLTYHSNKDAADEVIRRCEQHGVRAVAVGGDLRIDLFEHLSGHGSGYFAERFPGALAGRITTAANAAFSLENALTWTTIPPAAEVVSSIAVLGLVNWHLMATLAGVSIVLGLTVRHLAVRDRHLHDRYAARGLAMLGLALDDDQSVWQAALQRLNLPWQQGRLATGSDAGVSSVPAYWLLDPDGKIVSKVYDADELAAAVAERLK